MNNTTASSAVGFAFDAHEKKIRVPRIVILIVLALTTYFGNTLIIISLRKFSKYLKGTPFILLGNLAVADLFLAVGLTLEILGTIFTSLEVNLYFCVVKLVMTGISMSTSGKLLMFISLDRFCAIMFPLKHLANSKRTKCRRIHLAVIWTMSVSVGLIPIFVNLRSSRILEDCNFDRMIPQGMGLCVSVFILIQFFINIILCLLLMWRLRTNTMSRQKYKACMIKCGHLIKGYLLFVICWMPFVVTTILQANSDDKEMYSPIRENTIAPALFNSALNWIIYGFTNTKLRAAFKHILLCRSKRELFSLRYNKAASSDNHSTQKDQEQQVFRSSDTRETIT